LFPSEGNELIGLAGLNLPDKKPPLEGGATLASPLVADEGEDVDSAGKAVVANQAPVTALPLGFDVDRDTLPGRGAVRVPAVERGVDVDTGGTWRRDGQRRGFGHRTRSLRARFATQNERGRREGDKTSTRA